MDTISYVIHHYYGLLIVHDALIGQQPDAVSLLVRLLCV